MADDARGAIDLTSFRAVMGSFATGVTVITTHAHGEVHGMTASAFMSGSLVPPLCVVSIARTARTHSLLPVAGRFGVSILAQGQERLCAHFAGRPEPGLVPAFDRIGGAPVLAGAVAAIAAEVIASHDCGDHTLFVGRISDLRATGGAPLVVQRGRYASLLYADDAAPAPPLGEFW